LDTLPRVRVGRVVLALARWKLSAQEVKDIVQGDQHLCFLAVQALRQRRELPRWIVLQQADNTLPVDLDNALSVDAFLHVLKRTEAATLVEMYPPPGELCISGPEGRFHHELLVPFVKTRSTAERPTRSLIAPSRVPLGTPLRTRPPGAEWAYAKLYAGPA